MTDKHVFLSDNSIKDEEISLRELIFKIREWWNYLLSKWYIILIIGVLGGVLGFVYAWIKEPIYTAETTFVLEEDNGGGGMLGQLGGLVGLAGLDVAGGGGLFQGDNIIHLYKSRNMLEKALLTPMKFSDRNELLINRYIDFNKLREQWEQRPEYGKIDFKSDKVDRRKDSIITVIINDINENYLSVSRPDKKLSIISVRVSAPDELFAKEFSDIIVSTVNSFYVETKTKKSIENVNILQQKTDSVRLVMYRAIHSSAATIDATPNLNSSKQVLRSPVQRSQFNAETNKAVLEELVKNLELSKMALRKETPLIQVIDQPILPLAKEKLGRMRGAIIGSGISGILIVLFLLGKLIIVNSLRDE